MSTMFAVGKVVNGRITMISHEGAFSRLIHRETEAQVQEPVVTLIPSVVAKKFKGMEDVEIPQEHNDTASVSIDLPPFMKRYMEGKIIPLHEPKPKQSIISRIFKQSN